MRRAGCWLAPRAALEVLGLPSQGGPYTKREIKEAFYRKTQLVHPDKSGGNEEAFKELRASYEALTAGTCGRASESAQNPCPTESSPSTSGTATEPSSRERHRQDYEAYRAAHGYVRPDEGPNFSTWYFYRDVHDRRDTGFTEDELQAAARASRQYLLWRGLKAALFLVAALYLSNLVVSASHRHREGVANEGNPDRFRPYGRPPLPRTLNRPPQWQHQSSHYSDAYPQQRGTETRRDGPFALRYSGYPFTPEGVHDAGEAKKTAKSAKAHEAEGRVD